MLPAVLQHININILKMRYCNAQPGTTPCARLSKMTVPGYIWLMQQRQCLRNVAKLQLQSLFCDMYRCTCYMLMASMPTLGQLSMTNKVGSYLLSQVVCIWKF